MRSRWDLAALRAQAGVRSGACEDAGVGCAGHSAQPAPLLALLRTHPELVLFIVLPGAHCCPRAGSGWWSLFWKTTLIFCLKTRDSSWDWMCQQESFFLLFEPLLRYWPNQKCVWVEIQVIHMVQHVKRWACILGKRPELCMNAGWDLKGRSAQSGSEK